MCIYFCFFGFFFFLFKQRTAYEWRISDWSSDVCSSDLGAGMNAAAQHSQSVYALLTSMPGLKVVMPATPADAKGLLTEALRGDDPVMFMEHKTLYGVKGEVPEGDHRQRFGEARIVREGGDVTIVACGRMVGFSEKVSDKLAGEGIGEI